MALEKGEPATPPCVATMLRLSIVGDEQVGVAPLVLSWAVLKVKSAAAVPDVVHVAAQEPAESVQLALPITVPDVAPLV